MKYIISILFIIYAATTCAQVDRSMAPEADEPKPLELGELTAIEMDNGMQVFLVPRPGYTKITISINIEQPSLQDDDNLAARNVLTQAYYKGSSTKQTEEEIDSITGHLGAMIAAHQGGGHIKGMKRDVDELLEIYADQLLNPVVTEEDIKEKAEAYAKQLEKKKEKEIEKPVYNKLKSFALHLTDSLVYGSSSIEKKEEKKLDYSDLTVSDIKQYHKERIVGANMLLVVIGDFSKKEVKKLANKYFSEIPKGKKLEKESHMEDGHSILTNRQIYVINDPNAVQSSIQFHWGVDGLFPYQEDEFKIEVMNTIFGYGQMSYLYRNLREEKGLCYYVGSSVGATGAGGSAHVNTKVRNSETAVAVESIITEMMNIRNKMVSEENLDIAKNSIIGKFARGLSGISTVPYISYAMAKSDYDLPIDYLKNKIPNIYKVTAEDVKEMAEKYINPYECLITIEGKVEDLRGTLDRFGEVHYVNKEGKKIN